MPAYAVGLFRTKELHADMVEYLERLQATLDPFGGTFLVHGGEVESHEGDWDRDVVIIEFPGMDEARDWYNSKAYQEILPLRTRHIEGDAFVVQGVGEGYHPQQKADFFRQKLN
ncbi:DUF1330 domain-containing protein [Natronoglycomyces albus]|uniref:DUF1330 domain-containing protein n=1 Tax=Natronoglycomyces albus TaxID=2811108 RepID=A0A895XMP5_9ACTN|nr:DUF1330 domain-containing protein [Natronoglycomyces albus]QSB04669.1 DUF1330 domain-containing protein [Natronoglycomyces albus]